MDVLTSTMEDYLETIFLLEEEKRVVRAKDITKKMGVKLPKKAGRVKKEAHGCAG